MKLVRLLTTIVVLIATAGIATLLVPVNQEVEAQGGGCTFEEKGQGEGSRNFHFDCDEPEGGTDCSGHITLQKDGDSRTQDKCDIDDPS